MEGYKDVMLSEPPSRFAAAPSVHPVNLETYKGILLCDRPQAAAARNEAPIPFLPSGRPEDRFIGVQPSDEQRARLQMIRNTGATKGQTGNAAVTRHKKWLRSFADTVRRAKLDHMEAALVSETRAAAYKEKQAALRRQAHNNSTAEDNRASDTTVLPPIKKAKAAPKAKESRPKWAMTAEEADEAEDEEFLTQHDDLLQFAQSLDYGKFIGDLEVQEAMAIMKERVEEIMAETGDTQCAVPADAASRRPFVPARRPEATTHDYGPSHVGHERGWNASTRLGGGDLSAAINAEAVALADRILEGSESLRQVHTRQTLARLLRDAVDARRPQVAEMALGGSVQQPAIVRVGAESTGHEAAAPQRRVLTDMRKATDRVQNLPYLYRCPAL